MHKRVTRWYSPILDREMPIATYGTFGMPLLLFPTAAADFEENERFYLVDSVSELIDSGRVKVYSIDSVNSEAWMARNRHPADRARRQMQYDAYVYGEVAPFIWHDCRTPGIPITVSGASFGAYHSLNTVLKHPDRFKRCIAMAGGYDVRGYADGYYDENVYFNNPPDYMPRLEDPEILGQLRQCTIVLLTGQGAWEVPESSRNMSRILHAKGIPHVLDEWGFDVDHDWPWWRKMLPYWGEKIF